MGFTDGNAPGFSGLTESEESQVWWSGPGNNHQLSQQRVNILAGQVDSGNVPTSTLRGGNVMATEDGTLNAYIYDTDGAGGTQCAVGILEKHQNMLVDNTSTTRFKTILTTGLLKENELIGLDAQAKAQLLRQGFRFDNINPEGAGFLVHARGTYQESADTNTLVAADNGKLFVSTGAADVEFILPTIAVGLSFEFYQTIDDEMLITGDNNIAGKNGLAFSTITFTTDGEQIGAFIRVRAVYLGTALRWIVEDLSGGLTLAYAG